MRNELDELETQVGDNRELIFGEIEKLKGKREAFSERVLETQGEESELMEPVAKLLSNIELYEELVVDPVGSIRQVQ